MSAPHLAAEGQLGEGQERGRAAERRSILGRGEKGAEQTEPMREPQKDVGARRMGSRGKDGGWDAGCVGGPRERAVGSQWSWAMEERATFWKAAAVGDSCVRASWGVLQV